jgi:acyl-coenzyme A synthetase/AMP-(fatty) acid ligase
VTATPNIAAQFRAVALRQPAAEAVLAPDLTVSYENLRRIVDCFAHRMQEHGVQPGHLVAIDTTDAVVALASVLALSSIGAEFATFGLDLVKNPATRPDYAFRSSECPGLSGFPDVELDASWSPGVAKLPDDPDWTWPGFAHPTDACWLMHSSGTTGQVKFMRLPAQLVFSRVAAVMEEFVHGKTLLAMMFPPTSRPFIIRAMALLLSGGCLIDSTDSKFLTQSGTNFICASPRQIPAWLGGRRLSPRLPRLQLSGARVDDTMAKQLLDSFDCVEDVYGSSETIKAYIAAARRCTDGTIEWTPVPQDSELQVVDDAGQRVVPDKEGRLRIRNPYMISEYFNDAEATARAFRDGWFYPGDRARIDRHGRLTILGRSDAVINLGGVKVDLEEVDATLGSVVGVRLGVSFREIGVAAERSIAACLVLEDANTVDATVAAVRAACLDVFGPAIAPQRLFVVPKVPVTADGVPKRAECRRLIGVALEAEKPDTERRLI